MSEPSPDASRKPRPGAEAQATAGIYDVLAEMGPGSGVPGLGPRDPESDRAAAGDGAREGAIRARAGFLWSAFVVSGVGLLPPALCLAMGRPAGALTWLLLYPELVASSTLALAVGAWHARVPVIAWDDAGVVLAHRPWRPRIRLSPSCLHWRRGARYVGRYLHGVSPEGRRIRFPLWILPRRAAGRLFAYLDREGGPAPAVRPARPGGKVEKRR